jgi:hypothetical protein
MVAKGIGGTHIKIGWPMAEGGWVVLGAAVGTIGSILTTWLNACLTNDTSQPNEKEHR